MSSKEVEEEKKSDAGGKIKVPSFLHEETAKPKPAWMHKLAQARAMQATRNSSDPSITTKKEVQDEDEKEEEEDTPAALPSRQAVPPPRPPPLSSLDISEHSVKDQVQHLDATTPKGSVRKVPAGAPDYLLTGTVPKGKQLDEQTRKADLYVKHQQQQQQQQQAGGELRGSSSPSGILSAKLKTLQRLKGVRSSLTSGTDDSSQPVMTSTGNLPLAKKTILDSDSEEVFEDVDEEMEEKVVNDDTMDDDEDVEGWEEDSSASPLGEMSVEENDFVPPLAISRRLPLPPSPPAPEPVKPAPPSPQSPEQTTGPASHPKAAAFTSTTVTENKGILHEQAANKTTMEKETSIRSEQPFDEQGDDSWLFPHHNEDDSSWVNPSHPIQQDRKEHLNEELKKKSVDLFPENGEKTQRLANLLSIDEEQKYSDRDLPVVLDTRLGLIVEHHKDGETISATSFSEMSGKVDSTHIMESSVPDRELDVWAMPSQDRTTYRAVGRLDSHKDGKDYRFSYIATQHTHSTSSYSDVVRERYFPKEDNEYWAAPVKEEQPELPLHINRSGKVQSGPSDEKESWMPPEDGSEDETKIDKKALYAPSIAEEKHSEARSVATYDSDWMARNKNTAIGKTARIDFTGAITEESSDGSFTWNPERAPTPPPGEPTVRAQTLFKELPGPPHEIELSKENSNTRRFEATLAASPRSPSPAAQQPRGATPTREQHSKESAAPKEAKINDKYDYSPSGRLKFDMTPEMILIEDDVERGRAKLGSRRLQKNHRRRLCYLTLCFLFLLVPAGVACIVIFVIDPNDKRDTDSNSNAVPAVPTAAPFTTPTTPTKPTNDGQSKPPSPTQTFFPVPSPGAPTATNTPIEPDILVEFLTKFSSDEGASLQDTASAQYAAMQWIRSPANQGIFNDRVFLQRYALATLFYSTGGQQWASSSGWMTNTTECDWFTSSTVAQICDLDGNVVDLNLSSNNLAGPIPPEVNLLADNLASLQLHDNKLTGDLPRTLSDLSNLGLLNLANNLFRGTIPNLLESLSNLNTLFLYSNAFRRTIPSQLGNLANLRVLDLGSNRLTGSIPTQLGNIRGLESLALYNNDLTGSIPASLSNIPSLRLLYLDNNSLEPSLPATICNTLEFDEFWTDCEEIGGCDCCTKCCEDGQMCN